jgi:sugar transferase (PEP-CTERM system associated)
MVRFFGQYLPSRVLLLLISETLLILVTLQVAAISTLNGSRSSVAFGPEVVLNQLLITVICQICLYYSDLYNPKFFNNLTTLFLHLLQALGVCSLLVGAIYVLFPPVYLRPRFFMLAVLILLGILFVWRVGFFWVCQRRGMKRSILILGTGELAKKLAAEILLRPEVGVRIAGFVSDDRSLVGKSLLNPTVLGHTSELSRMVEKERVGHVVVAMRESRGSMPMTELLELKIRGVSIEEATSFYERVTGKIALENLRPSWLVFSPGFRKSPISLFLHSSLGITLSLLGLLLSFPLMIVIAVLIRLDSKGPVLFKQARVGKDGKTFQLLKFRSMRVDAEEKTGPVWAKKNDDRVTRVGRVIRKLRLDELPQFLNVLRGEMSFVGPRPERPEFVEELSRSIPYYIQRHTVRPGITGWAQVKYQYGASVGDAVEKLQYELFYIKNMSVMLDFYIIFQTAKIVLLGKGAQ